MATTSTDASPDATTDDPAGRSLADTFRTVRWAVWGMLALSVAVVAGALLLTAAAVPSPFDAADPTVYLAFLGAGLVAALGFVVVSVLDA